VQNLKFLLKGLKCCKEIFQHYTSSSPSSCPRNNMLASRLPAACLPNTPHL